jgi:hypothetical protein
MSCDCNTLVIGEAGAQGPQGLGGINGTNGTNGLNAFTTTSANFVQLSVGAPVTFSVVENRWIAVGQTVYISEAGFYTVTALGGSPFSSVTANLISTDGVSVGGTVTSGRQVSPSASAVYSAPLASLTVTTGGVSSLDGPVVINESGNNSDFRVEGDGDTHLLFCDANGGTNGRVGVSIDAPETTLHVDGSFKVGTLATPADAEFTRSATFNSEQSGTGTAGDFLIKTKNVSDTFFVDASADAVGIGTNTPSKLLDVDGAAEMNSLLVNPGGVAANPSFQVYGTNSTRPITVVSTNTPTNRVGIFNTNPSVELDVVGAATVTGATILGSTLAVAGNLSVDTNVLKVDVTGNFVGINKTTPTVALDVVGGTAISGDLAVDTNVLKVDTTGNFVGINKTTPTVALDVTGALAVSGASSLTTLGVSGDVSVAGGVLQVDTTTTRVGINDSTPSKTLDVNGTAGFTGNVNVGTLLYAKPGTGLGVNTEFPSVALDVTGATKISGNLIVATDDFVVDTTGHLVGINTASPATALDVVGITSASSGFRVAGAGSSNATLTKFKYATGASGSITPAANSVNSFTIAVTGAEVGDFVQATYTSVPATDPTYTTLFGYVSAADTVTVVISNGTSSAVGAAQVYDVGVLVTKAIAST